MSLKSKIKKIGLMTLALPMLLIGSVTGASAANDTVNAEETILYHCNARVLVYI